MGDLIRHSHPPDWKLLHDFLADLLWRAEYPLRGNIPGGRGIHRKAFAAISWAIAMVKPCIPVAAVARLGLTRSTLYRLELCGLQPSRILAVI
jgi:hypothetical protein